MTSLARRLPFHYGWLILAAGVLGNTVSGAATFWSVSVYVPAIADDFEVDRFPVVLAFMIGQLVFALVGPFAGRFIDRQGPRRALLISSAGLPLALFATSFSTSIWQLFIGWAVVSALRPLMMPIPYNWALTRWFDAKRQAALGVVTVGFGLGGAAILPLLAAVEASADWSAAMITSGVLVLVVQGSLALFIVRDRPSDLGLRMQGAVEGVASRNADDEWGFTAGQAVRTPMFWLLSIGLMFFFMGQGAMTTLAIDFFESRAVQGGAGLLAASALLRTIMRLPFGLAINRVDRVFRLAMVVVASQAIALGVLTASTSAGAIWTWVLLWGVGGALAPMIEPLLINRAFGVRHFGAISGVVTMISFGGQILGPIGGAALFDATDSYTIPFSLYVAGFVLSAVLFFTASIIVRSPSFVAAKGRASSGEPAPAR
ncbi:MAG: MFS transporter [Dehalococcoidia bacterium]